MIVQSLLAYKFKIFQLPAYDYFFPNCAKANLCCTFEMNKSYILFYVPGFSCTPGASISVSRLVLSGYRCIPLFIHSGLRL